MEHKFGEWVATCSKRDYSMDRRGGDPVFVIREGLIPMREDARLIAAAPDLLAALRDLTVDAEAAGWDAPEYRDVLNAARAAIAKATGGDQ